MAAARFAYLRLKASGFAMTDALLKEPFYFPTWPISPSDGRRIIKREFCFSGHTIEMAGPINWDVADASIHWHRAFFSYVWLQDVAAIQSEKVASSFAREFINAFTMISKIDRVHPCAWELEVAGERLTHWLYYRHFVLNGGSRVFCKRFQKSLAHHVQMLYSQLLDIPEALGPNALKGLIAASVIMPHCAFVQDAALAALEKLLARDILPDGGHVSLNPSYQLSFLKTLIEIRDMLESGNIAFDPLDTAISRLGEMLRFYCHGDGRLALLNNNVMEDALMIARALELSYEREEPPSHATSSGYVVLQADTTRAIIIAAPASGEMPAGFGALEVSDADERIIVNCGSFFGADNAWQHALTQPSAFSTLALQDAHDTPQDNANAGIERKSSRMTAALEHRLARDLPHTRHFSLHDDSEVLKGRDQFDIANIAEDATYTAIARFHLHPDVRCQPHKKGYMLTLVSGMQWLFTCNLPKYCEVTESVYLGYDGKPQKTLQLAITIPPLELGYGLQWELKKQS